MHMRNFTLAAVGLAALCGVALQSGNAAAMPVSGLANAASEATTDVQQVAWVCGPYRCWWRPRYYPYYGAYGWGGPRYYGYARPWWGHRRWAWRHW